MVKDERRSLSIFYKPKNGNRETCIGEITRRSPLPEVPEFPIRRCGRRLCRQRQPFSRRRGALWKSCGCAFSASMPRSRGLPLPCGGRRVLHRKRKRESCARECRFQSNRCRESARRSRLPPLPAKCVPDARNLSRLRSGNTTTAIRAGNISAVSIR